MRKSTIPVAVAIVAVLSLPAQAAKYTCTFYQAGNQVKQCSIDPTTSNTLCQQGFTANLAGFCIAGKSDDDKVEALWCGFGNPNANVTDIFKDADIFSTTRSPKPLAEKPGFVAQALSSFETKKISNFLVDYKESQSSPAFDAVCQ